MRIYFAGAESPSHLKTLKAAGVTRIALNVTSLYRRIPKSVDWSLSERFPAPLEVCLYPSPKDDDYERYRVFLEANPGAQLVVGPAGIEWTDIEHFVPLWDGTLKTVNGLCDRNEVVAASEEALKGANALTRLKAASMHHKTRLVALGASRELLRSRWEAAVISSWQSAQRYGETQVWDGRTLHRYATGQKDESRRRHRADIERLGIDPDAVQADDPQAVIQLAIRSWLAFEESRNPVEADSEDASVVAIDGEPHGPDSGDHHPSRLAIRRGERRHERVRTDLPVIGFEPELEPELSDGQPVIDVDTGEAVMTTKRTKLVVRGETMRICNTCMLAMNCPAFETDHTCAYSIPITARTKDDLMMIMDAMVEIQGQRILFARFAEEIEGQGLDPAVGQEMDRLFKILATKKDILDDRDVLRLELEARGSAGAISRIFGGDAGVQLRQLTAPVGADRVIDVLDGVDQ